MVNTEFKEIKNSLISALACELRASLWDQLVAELGKQKTLNLLLAAEQVATSNVRTLQYKHLVE